MQAQIEQLQHEEVPRLKLCLSDAHAVMAELEQQLAGKLNHDALRVRKFISGNPKVLKRVGVGLSAYPVNPLWRPFL